MKHRVEFVYDSTNLRKQLRLQSEDLIYRFVNHMQDIRKNELKNKIYSLTIFLFLCYIFNRYTSNCLKLVKILNYIISHFCITINISICEISFCIIFNSKNKTDKLFLRPPLYSPFIFLFMYKFFYNFWFKYTGTYKRQL